MEDRDLITTIDDLVAEEHRLREGAAGHGLGDADRARLAEVEQSLDQMWDLLRRRRARRESGEQADVAPRPAEVVENYEQ